MTVSQAIEQRRAVKNFDPDHKFTQDEIDQLMTLARFAPTSFNIQNWRFVLVEDPELRKQIRDVSWDQPQVTDSSLLIILCADLKSWEKDPIRYWASAPKDVQDFMVPGMKGFYCLLYTSPSPRDS